jgi:hypothetical protein
LTDYVPSSKERSEFDRYLQIVDRTLKKKYLKKITGMEDSGIDGRQK